MTMSNETAGLAVVTGASSGIGLATAQRLAADGYHVLAGVRRPEDAARIAADRIEPIILDITDAGDVSALADRIVGDTSRRPLRVLVNNAGIAVNAPIEVLTVDDWRRQFEVSVFGQIAVIRALLPALLASRGRVVNVTSIGGLVAQGNYGAYSGAKFAMEAASDSLRREVAEFGVTVVKVSPGAVSTNMTEQGLAAHNRIAATMTADQRERYGTQLRALVAQAEGFARDGVSPEVAAGVIARAVSARKPRTRYTVGRDAAIFSRVSRLASDRVLDAMLRSQTRRLAAPAR
ncbi:SDR family NAD(P)-dependent oxidoreductase [soil metagenome]